MTWFMLNIFLLTHNIEMGIYNGTNSPTGFAVLNVGHHSPLYICSKLLCSFVY